MTAPRCNREHPSENFGRCVLPAKHDGSHLSDSRSGQRIRWELVDARRMADVARFDLDRQEQP